MNYHIDRKVILSEDPKHKSLYEWFLHELDANGEKVGDDQIPWRWSFHFTASEITLRDALTLGSRWKDDFEENPVVAQERNFIFAKLNPVRLRGQSRDTSFSMFGTNRTISRIELHVEKLENESDPERCVAWGCVSYTAEIDFRNDTSDDCLVFTMYLRPEKFAFYASRIASSSVDKVGFSVVGVKGFYSGWSSSTSIDSVKVLTSDKEHEVLIPKGCPINPPRLGEMLEAELTFGMLRKLCKEAPKESDENEEQDDVDEAPAEPYSAETYSAAEQLQAAHDLSIVVTRASSILSSMRIAAWLICGILLLILVMRH